MVPGGTGEIRRLCELVDEYGDELAADFRQFYQLRLADVWRGLLSPGDALALAGQLGTIPGSRFRALCLGGLEFVGWTREADILADLHDALVTNSVVTIKSAGGKTQQPDPYPRPVRKDDPAETIEVPTIDEFPIHLVMAMTSQK